MDLQILTILTLGMLGSSFGLNFSTIEKGIELGFLSYPTLDADYNDTEDYTDWESIMQKTLGDIKLSEKQITSGIHGEEYRWRDGFFVQIDQNFDQADFRKIAKVLYELNQILCIDVVIWDPNVLEPSGDYVYIQKGGWGTGCWSYVGKLGGGQELNLETPGCNYHFIIMHELYHALGFFHEQERPDRDSYVKIFWENIEPGEEHNFEIFLDSETFNVTYDYKSIMHYGKKAWTINGKDTMEAINGTQILGGDKLTSRDVTKLKRMYDC